MYGAERIESCTLLKQALLRSITACCHLQDLTNYFCLGSALEMPVGRLKLWTKSALSLSHRLLLVFRLFLRVLSRKGSAFISIPFLVASEGTSSEQQAYPSVPCITQPQSNQKPYSIDLMAPMRLQRACIMPLVYLLCAAILGGHTTGEYLPT